MSDETVTVVHVIGPTSTDKPGRCVVFSSGSQHHDWVNRNCDRCWKYDPENPPKDCEIDKAIGESMFGDGTFSVEMSKRMGCPDDGLAYTWDCPERESQQSRDEYLVRLETPGTREYQAAREAEGQTRLCE